MAVIAAVVAARGAIVTAFNRATGCLGPVQREHRKSAARTRAALDHPRERSRGG
jgi:hypothetical protein